MNYIVDHISLSTPYRRRQGVKITPTTITIHNTANPSSTARNERAWLTNPANTREASWHIVVDDKEAIEAIPLDEKALHAGTSQGNLTSIGIEICESGDYAKALDNAATLVARLLKERGWGVDRLRRHFDWSGKICPRKMYDDGRWTGWTAFVNMVRYKLNAMGEDALMDELKKRIEDIQKQIETLKKQADELEKRLEPVPAPPWFVKEFGSADLGGLVQDPDGKKLPETWEAIALAARMAGIGKK